jgi:hypothetical protein
LAVSPLLAAVLWTAIGLQSIAPVDAPSVDAAREAVRRVLGDGSGPMRDATVSTTPEVEHIATGARCRFWYPIVRIDHKWFDDRAIACFTARDWLNIEVEMLSLEGPRRGRTTNPFWQPLLDAPRELPAIVDALARMWTAPADAPVRSLGRTEGTAQSRHGGEVRFFTLMYEQPGGAPSGTPARRRTVRRVALIGEWVFVVTAEGPVHYNRALDTYVAAAFDQIIEHVHAPR